MRAMKLSGTLGDPQEIPTKFLVYKRNHMKLRPFRSSHRKILWIKLKTNLPYLEVHSLANSAIV